MVVIIIFISFFFLLIQDEFCTLSFVSDIDHILPPHSNDFIISCKSNFILEEDDEMEKEMEEDDSSSTLIGIVVGVVCGLLLTGIIIAVVIRKCRPKGKKL